MACNEADYLLLSGIQHFEFCRRQWALIHIEQQWAENLRTIEGEIMHKNVHDETFRETRKGVITVRGMKVVSHELEIIGVCDAVEFISDENGIKIAGRAGKYRVMPVEYKHGEPKSDDVDILQLTAQAMCLEEMLCCTIKKGMLYYGKTHRRQSIDFSDEFREKVFDNVNEMYQMYTRKYTPKVKVTKSCNACSLKEICLPKLMKVKSVHDYIDSYVEEDAQ